MARSRRKVLKKRRTYRKKRLQSKRVRHSRKKTRRRTKRRSRNFLNVISPKSSGFSKRIQLGGEENTGYEGVILVVTHGGPRVVNKDVEQGILASQPSATQSSQQPATAEPSAGHFQSTEYTDDYCKLYYPDYDRGEKTLLSTQSRFFNSVYHYITRDGLERYNEYLGQFYIENLIQQVSGYLTSGRPNLEQNHYLSYKPNNRWEPLTYEYNRLLSMSDNTEHDVILSDTRPITEKGLQNYVMEIKGIQTRWGHTVNRVTLLSRNTVAELVYRSYCIGGRFDSNRFKTLNGITTDISEHRDDIMASIENNLTVGRRGCVQITIDHLSDAVKQQYPGYLLCVVCCTHNQEERGIERYSLPNK